MTRTAGTTAGPIVNHSRTTLDAAFCNGAAPALGPSQGRCGYGRRAELRRPYAPDIDPPVHRVQPGTGRIADHSFDLLAGSLLSLCDLDHPKARRPFLDPRAGLRLAGDAGKSFGAQAIESELPSAPTRLEVCSVHPPP